METIYPVDGSICSEFTSIYNQCGVMAPKLARRYTFLRIFFAFFWEKTLHGKIFKIQFRKFLSRHGSTCCVQISWNFVDRKSVKSCVATWQKIHMALQLSLLRTQNRSGPAQTIYSECSRFHPDPFTLGAVIAESVNIAKTRLASSRIITVFCMHLVNLVNQINVIGKRQRLFQCSLCTRQCKQMFWTPCVLSTALEILCKKQQHLRGKHWHIW